MKKTFFGLRLPPCLCALLFSRGAAAANESPADRIPNAPSLSAIRPASRHSGRVCASLGTWRGKTLSLSGDMQRESSIVSPRLRPS